MSRLSRLPLITALIAGGAAACASAPSPAPAEPAGTPSGSTSAAPPALRPLDGELASLVMRLSVDDVEARAEAARALGAMGADAAPALPELLTCAATEPSEGGGRDLPLDPGHLPDLEPTEDCAAAIAAIGAADPDALVSAMAMPLATKERALAALISVGDAAVPGVAAVYLDACVRAAGASDAAVRHHLETTAGAALAVLAASPASAETALEGRGACADDGIERVRMLASSR